MKTALITGANRGIGYEVARQLGAEGFHVFVGARNLGAGRQALEALSETGAIATLIILDLTDEQSVRRAAEEVGKSAEHLDVLVNNAGILFEGDASIVEGDVDLLRKTFETNTLGPLRVTQAMIGLLAKSRSPRIINVSSGGGQLTGGAEGWAPAYCISKTALNGVTSQLAAALPNFAVNSVCPGWVRTEMGGAGAPRSVEQGAETIVWLATSAPHSLTGKFLRDRMEIPW